MPQKRQKRQARLSDGADVGDHPEHHGGQGFADLGRVMLAHLPPAGGSERSPPVYGGCNARRSQSERRDSRQSQRQRPDRTGNHFEPGHGHVPADGLDNGRFLETRLQVS